MDEKHVDDSVNTKSINEKLKSLDKESATVEYTGIWGKLRCVFVFPCFRFILDSSVRLMP